MGTDRVREDGCGIETERGNNKVENVDGKKFVPFCDSIHPWTTCSCEVPVDPVSQSGETGEIA